MTVWDCGLRARSGRQEYANYRDKSDHRLDVDGLRRFWETRLQPVYDDIAADVATQTTQGAAAPQDPRH